MNKLYYGYYHSPIGVLEIVTSDGAILSVSFVEDFSKEPEENLIMKEAIKQLDEYFKGNRKSFNLRFEIHGTDFQKKVWNTLLEIPYGKTISYMELAEKIGYKKAIRAVGNANGKNKINIFIPCHRVIGSNENLRGYSGGLSRKKWLLDHENRF